MHKLNIQEVLKQLNSSINGLSNKQVLSNRDKYGVNVIDREKRKSLFVRFRIFCHGVKSEFDKVHWTTKDKMVKYSIMVVVFILAMSAFFYLIDVIFAFIQSLFN